MGAQAAPEGDVSLQQVPQTAVPGMGPSSGWRGKKGPYCFSPGSRPPEGSSSRYRRSRRLRVRRSPRSRRRSFLPRRMVVQPRPRRLPLRPGRAARRPRRTLERRAAVRPAGSRSCPSWTVCRRRGRRSRSLTRTEHMPVKMGEADTLDATEPDFAPRLAKAITEAEQEGARHVELKLAPEHLGKLSVELTQGKDGVLHIVFHAENEQAMKLLQEHSATLVSMLHGSHSGEIQVEVPRPQQGEQPWAAAGAAARTAARPQPTGTGTAAPEYRGLPAAASAGLAGRRSGVTEKGVARNEQ